MKKKITKILGIGLAFMLVASLMVAFAPVAAAAEYEENDWGEWGLPTLKADTNIGPIAVAPDGTLFAAIHFWNDDLNDEPADADGDGDPGTVGVQDDNEWFWKVAKSDDNGYDWDDTEWDDMQSNTSGVTNRVVSIAISPNYEEDETLYVGVLFDDDTPPSPTVWRLEEAGDGDTIALKELVDSEGAEANVLHCIDVWTDEEDINWILAATDYDVLVLRDKTFEDWRDQELAAGFGNYWVAYEVAFAPDFDDSDLIWAVIEEFEGWGPWSGDNFRVTATASPGQWGQDIGEVVLPGTSCTPWLDIDFPDDYDSDPDSGLTNLYIGLSGGTAPAVWLIEGIDADDGASNAIDLFDLSGDVDPVDILSIAVSGDYGDEVILAGAMWTPEIWISDDGGGSWDDVDKPPTGAERIHVIMEADVVWGGEVFDPDEGIAFAGTWGAESAVSRSDNGGEAYNQVGYIDTAIELVSDLGFHPDFPDTPTYLMSTYSDLTSTAGTTSLWLTENGDEDEPDYVRVLCGDPAGAPGNFEGWFGLVAYSWDGDAIYITGTDSTTTAGTVPGPVQSVVWKSTDDGQTFGKKRSVKDDAFIRDWVITDSKTIYAACWDFGNTTGGFYKTINSGLSWRSEETTTNFNDIALSPDFEDEEGFILLGGMSGEIMLSDNDGDTFDDAEDEEQSGLSNTGVIYVAFDADFADEDADGYMYIYAADDQGSDIVEGDVADTDDVNWDELEDDKGDGDPQGVYCGGLQVSEDNALYAIHFATGGVAGETEADGTLELTDGIATATFSIPDTPITSIVGTFEDLESLIIEDSSLVYTLLTTQITGTIDVEGDDSGAKGTFSVSIDIGWTADATVDVLDYNLWAEVTGAGAAQDSLYRLLLWESNNEWESEGDTNLIDPFHLWVTPGTNVLWTIDMDAYAGDAEVWVLEDTLSGSPTLDSPPDGYKSDVEEEMRISWDEMRGIDEDYEYKYTNVEPDVTDKDWTDEISVLLRDLSDSSEYEWKVRAAAQSHGHDTWSSRWSDTWSFFTALGEPPWTPTLYTPGGVWQYSGIDVDLMPAFSWESATNADSYQFMLADNAAFTSPLVNEKVPESAYQLDFELEYNSNYFWKVMAYKGTEALSRWSDIGAFTTVEKVVPTPPAPTPTLTVEPAVPIVLPTPIPPALLWTIIGIGALLIIAVIVLIIRTRRPV